MWTFKHPYTPEEQSRAYIENRGRQALSRALNIGRVVGFVASGATMGYGHPSWREFVKHAVKSALEIAAQSPHTRSGATRSAIAGLKRLSEDGSFASNSTQALGLAESLARMVGKHDEFREAMARLFSDTRNQHRDSKNGRAAHGMKVSQVLVDAGFSCSAEPLRALVSDLRISRLLTLNYDCEIEEEFHRLYRTTGTSRTLKKPRVYEMNGGVRETPEPESAFDVLCNGQFQRALDLPRRVEYTDGTSRSVLSVSMSGENIADLVNFAVQPRQYMGQVVHLHGRFDKPQDMVVTDEDYRRTYMKSDEQAQTFSEALSALLTGNDILFVGAGMREDDILRPLRQFISQDKTPDFAKRFVFAMLENKVTLDETWLKNSSGITDTGVLRRDFVQNHMTHPTHGAPGRKGAALADYCADEAEALRLHSEFGVLALFHGGQPLRTVLLALKLLEAARPTWDISKKRTADTTSMDTHRQRAIVVAAIALRVSLDRLVASRDSLLTELESGLVVECLNRLISDLKVGRKSPKLPDAALLRALTNEVRSRALERALQDLEKARGTWWEDWRQRPKERNSKFRPRYLEGDKNRKIPTLARHRPVYRDVPAKTEFAVIGELRALALECAENGKTQRQRYAARLPVAGQVRGGHIRSFNTNDMSYFRHLQDTCDAQTVRDFEKVPPRRIIRGCLPRGGGKGSLLHILQQPIDGGARLFLDTMFDDKDTPPGWRFHGAFCLHLSFSMEFASVITALSEFIESAMIGVLIEYPDQFLAALAKRLGRPEEGHKTTFLGLLHDAMHVTRTSGMRDAIREYRRQYKGCSGETLFATRKICDMAVRDDLRSNYWDKLAAARGITRLHRLEDLRMKISAFTDVVDLLKDQNLRLLIVMSGLDKLCDEQGNAYNPMFRGLFRLLTGCGAKYASESDVTAPIDLLLITGTRHRPIRYLTEEQSRLDVEYAAATPGHGAPLDFIAWEVPRSGAEEPGYLRDWPALPAITLGERYWLEQAGEDFRMKLTSRTGDRDRFPHILRMCREGVALFSWCAGAYQSLMTGTGRRNAGESALDRLTPFLARLDDAAMRGDMPDILRTVLEVHKTELRAWGAALASDRASVWRSNDDWHLWPELGLRQNRISVSEALDEPANRMVELAYLLLSHLALFPMPVEARVLYGCDEVREGLARICDLDSPPDSRERQSLHSARIHQRRLRLLNQLLAYLHESHLVIAVQAKAHDGPLQGEVTLKLGEMERSYDDVHTRFTIQHQLRDFVARLMDLSVPDQGERNFFQVSIYCDQPSDLPSPNEDHYRMVRAIMERQVTQVRNTTWCLMQLARGRNATLEDSNSLSDLDKKLAVEGLTRRFYRMAEDDPTFDPDPPAIHAVPQRIRALYGLLRGGFSIGTISRLPSLNDPQNDQPYERFRGWLRGVTNAAMGWDYAIDALFLDGNGGPDFTRTTETLNRLHTEVERGRADASIGPRGNPARPLAQPDPMEAKRLAALLTRPLYRDEIGWLLNERGLVALVTGHIFDAIPLFQRALDAMHHDDATGEYDPSLHAAVRRVRLNLAIALIERGKLSRASGLLNGLRLKRSFSEHGGSQVSWIAEGYLGLIDHIGGNHAVADRLYAATIEKALDRNMLRLAAIFLRHRADLKRRQRQFDDAMAIVSEAVSIAQKSAQRDVYHQSRISQALVVLETNENLDTNTRDQVLAAYSYGQSMGIPRLECDALRLQALAMLRQGERMLGGTFASRAAAIANRHGLRLTKLAALCAYGHALKRRGQFEAAHQILSETMREAERRGYQNLQPLDLTEKRAFMISTSI